MNTQIRFIDDLFVLNSNDFIKFLELASEGLRFPIIESGETRVTFDARYITLASAKVKVTVAVKEFEHAIKHALKFYA